MTDYRKGVRKMKSIKVSIADRPPNIELLIARLCELFLENKKVTAPTVTNKNQPSSL